MNTIDFQQTGGFPLETNTLAYMQNAYSIFHAFGGIAGDKTIITGCNVVGNELSNGSIYYNNELIFFKGGIIQDTIIIVKDLEQVQFEDGSLKDVYITTYATFGASGTSIPWNQFKRIDPLVLLTQKVAVLERKAAVFTQGAGMVLWNKPANEIPPGWREVVKWRGRMPVGYNPYFDQFNAIGKIGGSVDKRLKASELPPHSHGFDKGAGGDNGSGYLVAGSSHGTQSIAKSRTTNTGGGQRFSLMNPYRVVMFIEYIG